MTDEQLRELRQRNERRAVKARAAQAQGGNHG